MYSFPIRKSDGCVSCSLMWNLDRVRTPVENYPSGTLQISFLFARCSIVLRTSFNLYQSFTLFQDLVVSLDVMLCRWCLSGTYQASNALQLLHSLVQPSHFMSKLAFFPQLEVPIEFQPAISKFLYLYTDQHVKTVCSFVVLFDDVYLKMLSV